MTAEKDQIKFDLADFPTGRRLRVWSDALHNFHYRCEYKFPKDFGAGEFHGGCIGNLKIARGYSDSMTVFRNKSNISQDATDAYFLMLTSNSPVTFCQRGKESIISQRQFTIISTSEPYFCHRGKATNFHNILIPGNILRKVVPYVDDIISQPSRFDPVSSIFYDYATSICMNAKNIDSYAADVMSQQIVELIALVFDGADGAASDTTMRRAHYRRIVKIINQEFPDPNLNAQVIADRMKMSKRYIQSIFATHQTTVSTAIRRRRVAEACRLLKAGHDRSFVSEIAYRIGFTDLSHFSRVFKAETGHAPSQFARDCRR